MGLQMGNTVISSYIADCYPLQSMSVILFYSVFLDVNAFINPVSRQMLSRHTLKSSVELIEPQFFISPWVAEYGYTTTFAMQGIITLCVAAPGIALVYKFGLKMRETSGEPNWVNPEHDILS